MILGVDHLSLSTCSMGNDLVLLNQLGLQKEFFSENMINNECKNSFLQYYQPLHSLAFLRGKSGVGIELTEHNARKLGDAFGRYELLLSGRLPVVENGVSDFGHECYEEDESTVVGDILESLFSPSKVKRYALLTEENNCYWLITESNSVAVKAIILQTNDINTTHQFWKNGLKFLERNKGQVRGVPWVHLYINSPILNWKTELIVYEKKQDEPLASLDSKGFTCLALFSSNIKADSSLLTDAGSIQKSEIFQVQPNHQQFAVQMLRNPSGELIELIEVKK